MGCVGDVWGGSFVSNILVCGGMKYNAGAMLEQCWSNAGATINLIHIL